MAGRAGLQLGQWVWASFPVMSGKRRPGVFIGSIGRHWGDAALVVPATAERGACPGALEILEPPAEGLRACHLLTSETCLLALGRLRPFGARLPEPKRAALIALVEERFGAEWRSGATAKARVPSRLKPRPSSARRRDKRRRGEV